MEPEHEDQQVRRTRRKRAQLVVCSFFLAVVIGTAGVTGDWAPFWTGIGLSVVIVAGWAAGEYAAKRAKGRE
jgi:hypothetical protein